MTESTQTTATAATPYDGLGGEAGVRQLTIVPMFLGTGRHAREDLPLLAAALQEQHPDLQIALQQAVGEDPRMTALMAQIAVDPPAG